MSTDHPRPILHTTSSPSVRRRAHDGERGAIVLLAIAFITVLSVLFIALLAFADAGSSSLRAYRIERTRRYTTDAALQLAVQRLADDATFDTTTAVTCLSYPIEEDASPDDVASVVTPGSVVTVTCVDTPGAPVQNVDVDGGQAPRDITLQVVCQNSGTLVTNRKLSCGSGGTTTVIGSARVRFENNYDTATVPANERAVVPKVVSWTVRPEA